MATLTKEESERGIQLSKMTPELQEQVEKLGIDKDGDGKITGKEMEKLIESYLDTKKDNKFLRYLVTVLAIFSFLLTGCVFGASIAAARLSKDTTVDPVNGIMYAKGSATPIQTEPVAIRNNGVMINKMPKYDLDVLREISLDNGSIKFQVKGYAKSLENKQVTLIVEGGSLLYGDEGLVAATGMAETMLDFVYPNDVDEEGRRLFNVNPLPSTADIMSVPANRQAVIQYLWNLDSFDKTLCGWGLLACDSGWECVSGGPGSLDNFCLPLDFSAPADCWTDPSFNMTW